MTAPNLDEIEAELVNAGEAFADAARRAANADMDMTAALKRLNAAEAAFDNRVSAVRQAIAEARAHG